MEHDFSATPRSCWMHESGVLKSVGWAANCLFQSVRIKAAACAVQAPGRRHPFNYLNGERLLPGH